MQRPALCDGLTRREWLRRRTECVRPVAAGPFRARAAGATSGKAKACIVLFHFGGPPQHETWDPEAGRAGGNPRRVQADGHRRARRSGRRVDAAHRPADGQDLHSPGHVHRRQRPFVERLLDVDRRAAPADERREQQARRPERLAVYRRRRSADAARRRRAAGVGRDPRTHLEHRRHRLAGTGRRLPRPLRRPLALLCDPNSPDFAIPGLAPPPTCRRCVCGTGCRCCNR